LNFSCPLLSRPVHVILPQRLPVTPQRTFGTAQKHCSFLRAREEALVRAGSYDLKLIPGRSPPSRAGKQKKSGACVWVGFWRTLAWLEPISKSPEEDNKAGELDKTQEVLCVVLPADEDPTLPLNPSKEALNEPSSHEST
jgi:hypothetical protein